MTQPYAEVSRESLLQLLIRRQWQLDAVFDDAERWVAPADAKAAAVVVPAREDVADFEDVVSLIIRRVAFASGAEPSAIRAELESPRSDVLRLVLETERSALPLRESERVYQAARSLVTAALRSAESPRGYFAGRPTDAVAHVVDEMEVTAAMAGSFMVAIESPLPEATAQTDLPLQREAFLRLAAVSAELSERHNDLIESEFITRGASANLYRAAAELMGAGGQPHPLRLEFRWAPALSVPLGTPQSVVMSAELRFALLDAAAALEAGQRGQAPRGVGLARARGRFGIYEERSGSFRWRLRGAAGEVIATSPEAYASRERARAAAEEVRRGAEGSVVEDEA